MNSIFRPTIIVTFSLLSSISAQTEVQPSARFTLEDSSSFIEGISSVFAINKRDYDPFGKPQDLSEKKVVIPDDSRSPEVVPVEPQIEELINKLHDRVNVLGSGFLLGDRYLKPGHDLKVKVKDEVFSLEVLSVGRKQIIFIDIKTKKEVTLKLNDKTKQLEDGEAPELNAPEIEYNLDE